MRRAWWLAAALAGPAAGALAASVVTVSQVGRAFAVASVHIARGETIRFTNDDRFDHQVFVDAPNFKFQSAEQAPGLLRDLSAYLVTLKARLMATRA